MTKLVKQTESQTSLSTRVENELGKSNSLTELINNDSEPSFALIQKDYGIEETKLMLLARIVLMLDRVGCNLSDNQIEYLINDIILVDFYYFTISDIKLIERRMMVVKSYGTVKMQNLIREFELYDADRTELAMSRKENEDIIRDQNRKENIPGNVLKVLHNIIDEKIKKNKVIIISDKSIDLNKSKIETLKMLYPDSNI